MSGPSRHLGALRCFQATGAADRVEGLGAGMHVHRRRHTGRECRFQIFSVEVSSRRLDRERPHLGYAMTAREFVIPRAEVEQPDLVKRPDHDAMRRLRLFGDRLVGECVDVPVKRSGGQRAEIQVCDETGRPGRFHPDRNTCVTWPDHSPSPGQASETPGCRTGGSARFLRPGSCPAPSMKDAEGCLMEGLRSTLAERRSAAAPHSAPDFRPPGSVRRAAGRR
jgi:hypothetical protein